MSNNRFKFYDKKNLFKRPWGSYRNLYKGKNFLIKELIVNKKGCLSLQKHKYRSEHWLIFEGKPEITLGNTVQPSYLKDIDIPGEKLTYGDFSLRFLVDENLENYMKIHNWLTGLGFPETTQQFKTLTTDEISGEGALDQQFSDASLHILNSNFRDVAIVKFRDLFPVALSSLEFDASDTDINYFTADVTFKYTIYDILGTDGRTPL